MICPYCKSDIDDDSFHCDQCGKELFVCPQCGLAGKGRNCVEDGAKLVSRKQQAVGGIANSQSQNRKPAQPVSLFDLSISQPSTSSATSAQNQPQPSPQISWSHNSSKSTSPDQSITTLIPILRLVNKNIGIDVEIKNNDIIGRNTGNHVDVFCKHSQISGQHAQFIYTNSNWVVTDLNSTNGTAVNTSPNWHDVPKLQSHSQQVIRDGEYLLIANIELQIKIGAPQGAPTGTQRL